MTEVKDKMGEKFHANLPAGRQERKEKDGTRMTRMEEMITDFYQCIP